MAETRNAGREMQAEILNTVRRGQQAVIEAIKTCADAVRTVTLPMPEMTLPFTGKLPKPEELVGNAYDFAEKLLASQRKFAEDVLQAATPLLPGKGDTGANKIGGQTK